METIAFENTFLSQIFDKITNDKHLVLKLKPKKNNILILDKGLFNIAICESNISKIEPDLGNLYYRGIKIEEFMDNYEFEEVAFRLIFGNNTSLLNEFKGGVYEYFFLPDELKEVLDALPDKIHPMDFLSIGVTTLNSVESKYIQNINSFFEKAQFLIAQTMVIATYYYLKQNHQLWLKKPSRRSLASLMIYQISNTSEGKQKDLAGILNKLLILHAEHEQNCSAFTVKTVASTEVDMYNAIAAGVSAFKGKLHGGASQFVIDMYNELIETNVDVELYIKNKIINKNKIMGLGHRVYRCWDPRAKIMLDMLNKGKFESKVTNLYIGLANKIITQVDIDEFFISRNICPNPDLLNCIFYNYLGVPSSMNTVMLSISRVAGWLAHYYESIEKRAPLIRPRQLPEM